MPSEAPVEVNEDLAAEIGKAVDEVVTEEKVTEEKVTEEKVTEEKVTEEEITEEKVVTDDSDVASTAGTAETAEVEVIEAAEKEATEVTDETVADETVGDEETPKISDEVLTQAVQAGIPLADARMFPSEASLTSWVGHYEQRQLEDADDLRVAKESLREKKEEVTEKKDPFAGLPKLDPDTYEPEVIKYFEGLKEIVQQQQETIESFQGRQDEDSKAAGVANSREVEKWFNGQVADLGENFVETLGAGDYASLNRGGPQYANREKLADQVSVLLSGYEAMGQEAPPREEVFRSAARLVFADEYQKIHEGKLAGKLEKQASQHIQRAGGQQASATESPMEEAARLIDERYPS